MSDTINEYVPLVYYTFIVLIPCIPAVLLFTVIPSTGVVQGKLQGMEYKLGGGAAAYVIILVLLNQYDVMNSLLNAPRLGGPTSQYWDIDEELQLDSQDTYTYDSIPVLERTTESIKYDPAVHSILGRVAIYNVGGSWQKPPGIRVHPKRYLDVKSSDSGKEDELLTIDYNQIFMKSKDWHPVEDEGRLDYRGKDRKVSRTKERSLFTKPADMKEWDDTCKFLAQHNIAEFDRRCAKRS